MNYIKHLTGFFEKVAIDKTLNPTHISLYIALFQFWNCNRFKNPISISRDEVMRISKISSKATYHKCLKNLHTLGYINYEPSYNPFKGSHVHLFNFSEDLKPLSKNERKLNNELPFKPATEQALNKSCTSNETSTEQAVVPYINNTNIPNISNDKNVANLNKQAKKMNEIENDFVISTIGEITSLEKKLREKKKSLSDSPTQFENNHKTDGKDESVTSSISSRANNLEPVISSAVERLETKEHNPKIENVKTYFLDNNFPELEAQKFFNYFSSIGWLVGGKTPMVDWQAAAQNWMLNSINFNHNINTTPSHHRQNLNTTTDKNYAEPL